MVAIFPKLCLWRRSLCSNLGGIGLEKLYRATLNQVESLLIIDSLIHSLIYLLIYSFIVRLPVHNVIGEALEMELELKPS